MSKKGVFTITDKSVIQMRIIAPIRIHLSFLVSLQLVVAAFAVFAGTIEYYDGTVEKGNIVIDSRQIRLKKNGSETVLIIPNQSIRFVELAGTKYSYNADNDTWVACDRNVPISKDDVQQTETVSFEVFKAPFQNAGEKDITTALDSIFFMNFYEVKYLGYNCELIKELNCIQYDEAEACGFSYTYPDVPNSGLRNLIAGSCLLSVGFSAVVAALSLREEHGVAVGAVFFAAAGVQFSIRGKRNREYKEWKK